MLHIIMDHSVTIHYCWFINIYKLQGNLLLLFNMYIYICLAAQSSLAPIVLHMVDATWASTNVAWESCSVSWSLHFSWWFWNFCILHCFVFGYVLSGLHLFCMVHCMLCSIHIYSDVQTIFLQNHARNPTGLLPSPSSGKLGCAWCTSNTTACLHAAWSLSWCTTIVWPATLWQSSPLAL